MGYDEKVFKKSANKKAMYMWLFTAVILSAAYTIELIKGGRTPGYYTAFMLICWIPFILGVVFLKIKGMDTTWYKETITIGYGVFYAFTVRIGTRRRQRRCPAGQCPASGSASY